MSAPIVPQLNPSGVNRNTILEVKIGGVYTPVAGVKNFDPTTDNANMQDDQRYSDGGYNRQNKTGTGWSATCVVARASTALDGTVYDPAQEYLRGKGEGQLGVASQVDIRWYEYDPASGTPRVEAKQGLALVTYKGPGGDPNGNREATFTFDGQGALNTIAHPYPNTATVPTVAAQTSSFGDNHLATAGGTAFRLLGSKFTGTTAVNIAGNAATSFQVWSDNEITGVAAAHAAGSGLPVIVTNGVGASTAANIATYA